MLPNIRAVFATIAVAVALLIIAFGVVATFRIAQESRAGSLHADLAQRGHASLLVAPAQVREPDSEQQDSAIDWVSRLGVDTVVPECRSLARPRQDCE